jgi:hypothetical protein
LSPYIHFSTKTLKHIALSRDNTHYCCAIVASGGSIGGGGTASSPSFCGDE